MSTALSRLAAWSKSDTAKTLITSADTGGRHTLADDLAELLPHLESASHFKCFRCGDGYTPLYCLNCAKVALAG